MSPFSKKELIAKPVLVGLRRFENVCCWGVDNA